MRAIPSLAALVAGGLIHQSVAHPPSYGYPDGGSDTGSNGHAGGSSSRGDITASTGGLPAGFPGGPSCAIQATTTVFVTVYPTSPVFSQGGFPGGSGSGQTDNTLHPTTTVRVSPVNSVQTFPPPWTTITLGIWGTEADSGTGSGPATFGSAPDGGVSVPGSQSGGAHPTGYSDNSNAPRPNPMTVTVGPFGSDGSSGTVTTAANVQHGSPWYTIVTDSGVQWVTGSDGGPSPVTILSEHTLTLGGAPTDAAGNVESLTCVTTTGADGRPTVLEWPIGNPQGGGGGPPVSTAAGAATGIGGNPVPQGASAIIYPAPPVVTVTAGHGMSTPVGAGMSTAYTSYTVLGTDGIPTVVHSSWAVPQNSPVTGAPGVFPTAPPGSGQSYAPPNGVGITSCTTYTTIGPDGKPTVVESTLVLPGVQATQTRAAGNPPDGVPIQVISVPGSPGPVVSGGSANQAGITTCTTYTVLGVDGRPTIVDKTYVIPGPLVTPAPVDMPGGVITGVPPANGAFPGSQSGNAGQGNAGQGITTCVTYAAIGPDGRPTIVESTVVMPASDAVPTASGLVFPPFASQQPSGQAAGGLITTAVTVDVLGPNGIATPVVETIVLTPAGGAGSGFPPMTTVGYPSMAPQPVPTDLPQGIPPFTPGNAVTTCVTVDYVGPDGVVTPVIETIVLTPGAPGSGGAAASPIVNTAGVAAPAAISILGLSTLASGAPPLDAYGTGQPNQQTILPPSAVVSGVDALPTGVSAAPKATLFTIVTGPNGIPVLSQVTGLPIPSYGSSDRNAGVPGNGASPSGDSQAPNGYGWGPLQASLVYGHLSFATPSTAVQTRVWTNVISEQTTTYTINFPFTTLASVAVPEKRGIRRQEDPLTPSPAWKNSTTTLGPNTPLGASLSSALASSTAPSLPPPTPSIPSAPPAPGSGRPSMCPSGGKIGNTTVNFDTLKPGPLLNPAGDLWFSEGFLVAPPSTMAFQSYSPASGGQLVEFVPGTLSATTPAGGADIAEIGVGPNSANPCFRFDFFGADLGCAAQGSEKWCEFVVSAYAFNEGSLSEQSIAWSETKRVPACPDFPNGSCSLTPVEFEGYTNITSVLISLHVGLELRAWWGDDFRFGWTDNSCQAASCRGRALPQRVKRETVESTLRRGVWHWTPAGLQRLDDEYIWESAY